ncbi:MAG: hypothetical protein H6581_12830 [Bacteroidia bacterium]|nr:hypothetical protein [Bacteroidia bacterium]
MKHVFTISLHFLLALSAFSQKKPKVQPLLTDIRITLLGQLENGKQKFVLEYASDEVYECSNVAIVYELVESEGKITVKLQGKQDPEVCLTAIGPAKARVDLSHLAEGEYEFKTQYRNYAATNATLVVSDDTWKFVVHEESMITFNRPILRKIPKGTVWGKLEYNTENQREVASSFLQDLEKEQCEITDLKEGNYGEFYLRTSGRQIERKVEGEGWEMPFVYHYAGEFERLKILVKMYAGKYGDDLRIRLMDDQGNQAFSWKLK